MIFIANKELVAWLKEHKIPLFRGYVNGITEREGSNGGKIKTYRIGSQETLRDGTKENSTWFCKLIGDAKKKEDQLQEGTPIDVYSFKETNVSRKNESGGYDKAFLNFLIVDFEVRHFEPRNDSAPEEDKPY
jgi:hypothetical protein